MRRKSKKIKIYSFEDFTKLNKRNKSKWINQQTRKIIKKLPTLKKYLTMYDDRSGELYTLSKEEIRLFSKVTRSDLEYQRINAPYIEDLIRYGNTSATQLLKVATEERIKSFLDNIEKVGGTEEKEYAKQLLDKLSDNQKAIFTKSKYFFDNGNNNSEEFVKFYNEYGISVGIAKLEAFLVSRRIKVNNAKFYEKGVNTSKLGRKKKKD